MAKLSAGNRWEGRAETPIYRPLPGAGRAAGPASDDWMEKLAWLMDRSIPIGGKYAIGLDGILGLIPGVGDIVSGLVGTAIVFQAHRMGAPRITLMRMVANIGIDSAIGTIPLLGDLFDFAWQANTRNLQLYRQALAGAANPRRDAGFLAVVLVSLGLVVALPILFLVWLATKLW